MRMAELVLYHNPAACSQVSRIALTEVGLDHRVELIDFALDEQNSPGYRELSPLGKVPLLTIDGEPLAENLAILTYIGVSKPDAGLFPPDGSPLAVAQRQSGLAFCSATLHPIVLGIALPSRLTDGDQDGVRSRATALAVRSYGFAEQRLTERGWWLGAWSIVDVYLNWTISTARRGGFDFAPFPLLDSLHDRLLERPAYARVMEADAEATASMAARRAASPAA